MKNTQFGVMNEYSFDVNNKLQCIIYIYILYIVIVHNQLVDGHLSNYFGVVKYVFTILIKKCHISLKLQLQNSG